MNLVLHHFFKEFRYLRLRWFAFLLLLGFDLAVNLEWLMPMRAGEGAPGWLSYVPVVILLTGLSLLLSCPEDRPGSDRSFVGTRPLPWAAYWQARLLLWLGLIVLPVVVQNGLYLALSGRPWSDVLRGAGERACFAAGFSAWLLPALALWRRREVWKALFFLVVTLAAASKVLDVASAAWWSFYPSYDQTWAGLMVGWMVFGGLSGWLAWKHLQQAYSFRRRLCLTCFSALVGLMAARFWVLATGGELVAQDEALVQALAPGLKVKIDLDTVHFEGFESEFGTHTLSAQPETETGKPGVHAVMRLEGSRVIQDGRTSSAEAVLASRVRSRFGFGSPQDQVHRGDVNLRDFFPEGTLFYSAQIFPMWSWEGRRTALAAFDQPYPAAEKRLKLATDYHIEWYQRDLALELPMVAGSRAECDEARWEVLSVTPAGGPQPGALTITLRVETRDHWNEENGSAMLLHSPQRQIVWLDPAKETQLGTRASHTGWLRRQIELTWNGIFNHADGEATGVDSAKLRLILLRSRFLGSSPYTWKSPEMRLADFPSAYGERYSWHEARLLYGGRQMKAFQERMATFKPLTAESGEKEARRALYELFSTAGVTGAVYVPAAYPAITQAFEPLGKEHLPLLLELPSSLWPGWSDRPPTTLLDRYLTEDQRDAVIERVIKQPGLAEVVLRKGWAEEAKRLKPRLLSGAPLPRGCEALLFAWGDDESRTRLLQAAKHDIYRGIIEELDKIPMMRPETERIAMNEFEKTLPMTGSDNHRSAVSVSLAANFGSPEAFDLCLRWMALGGDLPPRSGGYPRPHLLTADGGKFWEEERKMPDHEKWPFFRRLKVSDFEYVPEKRAWKFRQP
ncbi:hypothetical protein [Prosthecobacter sp.]|uniref:hypothetical protein n=1 Tax=Prosthecobacter sp. TaxID=1965333 RepID=UPI0037838BE0